MKVMRCKTYDAPMSRVLTVKPSPVAKLLADVKAIARRPLPTKDEAAPAPAKTVRTTVAVYGPGKFELEVGPNGMTRVVQVREVQSGMTTDEKRRVERATKEINARADRFSSMNEANSKFWSRP